MSRHRDQIEKVIDGTESVVPLATRADLKFARQELVDGDIERVRAGMELMVWTYDDDAWLHHVQASAERAATNETEDGNLVRSRLFGKGRKEWVVDQLEDMPLPTVIITSTGILFGEIARLWRGSRHLTEAHVEKRQPKYLVLTFARRWLFLTWALRELWVPVPEPLESDAYELAEMLNSWLERGAPGPVAPRP